MIFLCSPAAASDVTDSGGITDSKEYLAEQEASGVRNVARLNATEALYRQAPLNAPEPAETWHDHLAGALDENGKTAVQTFDADHNGKIDLVTLDHMDGNENVLSSERWHIDEADETVRYVDLN